MFDKERLQLSHSVQGSTCTDFCERPLMPENGLNLSQNRERNFHRTTNASILSTTFADEFRATGVSLVDFAPQNQSRSNVAFAVPAGGRSTNAQTRSARREQPCVRQSARAVSVLPSKPQPISFPSKRRAWIVPGAAAAVEQKGELFGLATPQNPPSKRDPSVAPWQRPSKLPAEDECRKSTLSQEGFPSSEAKRIRRISETSAIFDPIGEEERRRALSAMAREHLRSNLEASESKRAGLRSARASFRETPSAETARSFWNEEATDEYLAQRREREKEVKQTQRQQIEAVTQRQETAQLAREEARRNINLRADLERQKAEAQRSQKKERTTAIRETLRHQMEVDSMRRLQERQERLLNSNLPTSRRLTYKQPQIIQ